MMSKSRPTTCSTCDADDAVMRRWKREGGPMPARICTRHVQNIAQCKYCMNVVANTGEDGMCEACWKQWALRKAKANGLDDSANKVCPSCGLDHKKEPARAYYSHLTLPEDENAYR